VVAERSGDTELAGPGTTDGKEKGEELIYNQKLQNRMDLVLLTTGGLYVLVKGSYRGAGYLGCLDC
jgi:hypothetical protein